VAAAQLPAGGAITVLDHNGTIVARFPEPDRWVGQSLPDAPLVQAALSRDSAAETISGVDGVTRLYAFSPVANSGAAGLHVTVGLPTAVAYAAVWSSLALNLIAVGAVLLVALAAAW
jgi:hypothetical protein